MENLLDYFFPAKCMFCKRINFELCPNCLFSCRILSLQVEKIEELGAISVFEYEGNIREIIKASKYKEKTFSVLKHASAVAAGILTEEYDFGGFILVPIPLSKEKQKDRGFNQAEIIAKEFSKKLNIPVENYLKRTKNTKAQFEISKEERFSNLDNAFEVSRGIKGLNIVLVDDICTTGATLLSAQKVLKDAGAECVIGLTLARAL